MITVHRKKHKDGIIQGITISRTNLIEILVIAVFLGLGLNLIGGYILATAVTIPILPIIIGIILCMISILYIVARLLAQRIETRSYEAFIVYDHKRNKILNISRYEFGETVYQYMRDAFSENPALNTQWEREPLSVSSSINEDATINIRKPSVAAELLREAVEYFVLTKLSIHLTDYFADETFVTQNLKIYERKDIPDILLRNRFLEIFSRPMKDRAAFVDDTYGGKDHGKTVAAYVPGARYEEFDLTLPKMTTIQSGEGNSIEIKTEKLTIAIAVRFAGYCTILPSMFHEYYLGIDDWLGTVTDYQVDVGMQISTKLGALFSIIGWQYYHWIDSFLDTIDKALSKDRFFEDINWESALTIFQYLQQTQKEKSQ